MRYRLIIFLSAALIGGAAMAQTPPALRSDLSLLPAPSSSTSDYRAGSLAVPLPLKIHRSFAFATAR